MSSSTDEPGEDSSISDASSACLESMGRRGGVPAPSRVVEHSRTNRFGHLEERIFDRANRHETAFLRNPRAAHAVVACIGSGVLHVDRGIGKVLPNESRETLFLMVLAHHVEYAAGHSLNRRTQ